MSRRRRSYLPGVAFHVTARVQGHGPLFVEREQRIVEMIRDTRARSDARVVAYVIMPNHLHLVVIHGRRPLADYMQPLLCRIALLVRRTHEHTGHVFERRYRESPCLDPEYYRNAITYVHLNPVRAGLVADAASYPWSSHTVYCDADAAAASGAIDAEAGLRIFADEPNTPLEHCIGQFARFIAWRIATDRYRECGSINAQLPPLRPMCRAGDAYWDALHVAPACDAPAGRGRAEKPTDLRDLALTVLSATAPDMPLELLRSGDRARQVARVRRELIAQASLMAHEPRYIARFLGISVSAVSHIKRELIAAKQP